MLVKQGLRDGLLGLCLVLSACSLLFWPESATQAVQNGLSLCSNVIVPSLFPFFILSSLVVELGLSRYLGQLLDPIMMPLFRVNGSCGTALALGFVSGYPVGARSAIELYRSGQCTKTEAERLLAFCNNSGPAFIFGVVGAGILGSGSAGLVLYFAHLTASLLVGLLFRFYKANDIPPTPSTKQTAIHSIRISAALTHSVSNALNSILSICSFILFFSVLLAMLVRSGIADGLSCLLAALFSPLGMDPVWAQRLLTGLLELSSGVSSLTNGTWQGRLSMAAFMLGWAGLSVHCQVIAFMSDSTLSVRPYLIGKTLHGLFSALLIRLIAACFPLSAPASAYLVNQTEMLTQLNFQQVLTISLLVALGVWLLFLLLTAHLMKKKSSKAIRYRL